MDSSDKNVKDALEGIFGEDFIEIDVSTLTNDKTADVNERFLFTDKDDDLKNNEDVNNLNDTKKEEAKDDKTDIILETNVEQTDKKEKIKFKSEKKYKIIIALIFTIILITLIFIFINNARNKIRVKTCKFNINVNEYKVSEEYKITYKNNDIIYVDGIYKYTALNEEFKSQIDYIKQDKLNVLVNSNGMPGFTYIYEVDDDSFKISSYLDFNLIEFEKVDKIDQKVMPLSYFKINSKLTRKKLIETLEKKEFICNKSK